MSQGDRTDITTPTRAGQKSVGRIGGACFVCRAKKRKCSGENERFSRAAAEWLVFNQDRLVANAEAPSSVANGPGNRSGRHISIESFLLILQPPSPKPKPATLVGWGLPKHFIRKLESRLRRTETLLRSLLDHVSDEQLESSLRDIAPQATLESSQDKENADPNVWQFYPLTTLEDVRAWQSRTAGPEASGPQPTAHSSDEDAPVEDDSLLTSKHGGMSGQGNQSPRPIRGVTASPDTRTRTPQVDHYSTTAHSSYGASSNGDGHGPDNSRVTDTSRRDETIPLASTFLPAAFQEEFLW